MSDHSRFTIVQQGDGNTANQINGSVGRLHDPVADYEAMTKFVKAAAGSLAALDLPPAVHGDATRMLEAMGSDAVDDAPGRARRREMAAALRRIVEGAAGSALGAALLGIWHP
jgi:hypothetical protein